MIANLKNTTTASKENLLYKCGWSPLEGFEFSAQIEKTFVNGLMVYDKGIWDESNKGKRMTFKH